MTPIGRGLIATVGIAVCAPLAAQQSELDAARAAWTESGIASYEYGYHRFCECYGDSPPETLVTVAEGEVTSVRHRRPDSTREVPAAARNLQYYWTVADLFDLIDSAIARDATVRARFDPIRGYPTSIYIDYVGNMIGDEVDVRITRLTVL